MTTFLTMIGEELCKVVWEKTERGADDRYKAEDLPVIFAAACVAAIQRSADRSKAVTGAAEVFGAYFKPAEDVTPPVPVQ